VEVKVVVVMADEVGIIKIVVNGGVKIVVVGKTKNDPNN
jgi:hypothetical protein